MFRFVIEYKDGRKEGTHGKKAFLVRVYAYLIFY